MEVPPEHYMRCALALAVEALEFGEFPIAAIVVLDGQVIGQAVASEQREKRTLGHAELVALEQADRLGLSLGQRRRARLFTTLEPCLMCMGAAMSFFLGEIYYGLESPGAGAGKKPIYPGTNFQRSPAACLGRRALIFSRPTSV